MPLKAATADVLTNDPRTLRPHYKSPTAKNPQGGIGPGGRDQPRKRKSVPKSVDSKAGGASTTGFGTEFLTVMGNGEVQAGTDGIVSSKVQNIAEHNTRPRRPRNMPASGQVKQGATRSSDGQKKSIRTVSKPTDWSGDAVESKMAMRENMEVVQRAQEASGVSQSTAGQPSRRQRQRLGVGLNNGSKVQITGTKLPGLGRKENTTDSLSEKMGIRATTAITQIDSGAEVGLDLTRALQIGLGHALQYGAGDESNTTLQASKKPREGSAEEEADESPAEAKREGDPPRKRATNRSVRKPDGGPGNPPEASGNDNGRAKNMSTKIRANRSTATFDDDAVPNDEPEDDYAGPPSNWKEAGSNEKVGTEGVTPSMITEVDSLAHPIGIATDSSPFGMPYPVSQDWHTDQQKA